MTLQDDKRCIFIRDKYKAAQTQHVEKLKEQAKLEGNNVKDRVKELSKETNRRRRALENKKKQLEEEEEKQREEVLAERHKLKEEATQRFQKESLNKKKTRPNSGKESGQTGSPQLQDGIRIVRGHVVDLKNGQQVTKTAPTLEDALNLVNNPYKGLGDHDIQYYGPNEMYQDLGNDYTKIGTFSAPDMNQGQIGTVSLSGAQNPYSYVVGPMVSNSNHGNHGYDSDQQEQIRLRENALQNGGPKFAFMNEEWTDGALPQTMGRDSPAGSLTSLDSLDEVPSDNLVTRDMSCQGTPVTGIIVKDNKVKSAGRRRVTFSDSIEFDDGLTGQLVTAEKASCKQYVKLYNSRVAASNAAYNASLGNAPRPTAPIVKEGHSSAGNESMIGTPGNTPMKNNGLPSSVTLQSGSSASMIVPKSIYSQISFSGNATFATTGEATSSSTTQTDHPAQCVAQVDSGRSCVAQVDSGRSCVPRPHGPYGTGSHGTSEGAVFDGQGERQNHEEDKLFDLKDSLDVVRDSLDYGEEEGAHQHDTYENKKDLATEEDENKEDACERFGNKFRVGFEPAQQGTTNDHVHVDYYGNPTTIYRNPFGQQITAQEASQAYDTTTANLTSGNSSTQLSSNSSLGNTHAFLSGSAGQFEGTSQGKTSKGTNKDFVPSSTESKPGAKNSSSYHSWYPGSFFPSKSHVDTDGEIYDGDGEVFEDAKYTDKNNSVAYELMDDQQGLKQPPNKRKNLNEPPRTVHKTDRLENQGPNTKKSTNTIQETLDRQHYRIDVSGRGYPVKTPEYDHTTSCSSTKSTMDSNRAVYAQNQGYPTDITATNPKQEHGNDKNDSYRTFSPYRDCLNVSGMTAKPPHPSTRHKGVVYSSPLHRKRAAAAARHNTGKISPKNAGRKSPRNVVRKKEDSLRKNAGNQRNSNSSKVGRKKGTREMANSESDDDEMMEIIKRDMERINMQSNASPAQEEHHKIMNNINLRGQVDSPIGQKVLDTAYSKSNEVSTKSDFRTVYKKVHQPRVGSAKQRSQKTASNKVPPSKIPTYVRPSGNVPTRAGEGEMDDGSASSSNQTVATPERWAEQGVSQWADTNELRHPQTTNLKRSISLDKTPTDDEINILWDRVRNCLNHKEAQSVGSDSCVNKIDVRRSKTGQFVPQGSQDNTLRDPDGAYQNRATSIPGMGTIGGLRRYGSHEVLRRYGSADNLGCRPQPLLQHRALRTRQSGQGKPPIVLRQQMNLSPMSSRQAPTVSLSTRAAAIPLTQTELRAVMKASQQTQERLFTSHYKPATEQPQGYQTVTNTRKAPSALSIEEHRLLESLDRLNERLKVQETITANITHNRTMSANPSSHSRPASKHQRASSSTYK